MLQIARGSYVVLQSHSDSQPDPKTFRNWKWRTFSAAVATNRSEYFIVKRKRRNVSAVCPGLEEKT